LGGADHSGKEYATDSTLFQLAIARKAFIMAYFMQITQLLHHDIVERVTAGAHGTRRVDVEASYGTGNIYIRVAAYRSDKNVRHGSVLASERHLSKQSVAGSSSSVNCNRTGSIVT